MDLVVNDLTIEYTSGDYTLRPVDNLSFTVPSGSLALLLGPSGCGKSTLLSCLAGILTPTSGTVSIGGKVTSSLTGGQLTEYRRHTVGIVFQSFNLVPSLTAAENVMAPLRAAGMRRGDAQRRAAALLDGVSLTDRASHLPAQLSGGQQQRVAIARALAHEPPVVLADEPTAHLDYVQVESVLRLIRSLAKPGRSVVVATHDERMLPLADVVVEMLPKFVEGQDKPERLALAGGEVVFEQGSLGGKIYVVDAGEVEIERDGKVVYVNKTGEHFGEMGPLFNLPRSATARAGAKGAKLTGYSLRQYSDIVGLDTLGDVLGKTALGSAPPRKRAPAKKAPAKKAPAAKVAAKKPPAKKAPAKKAAAKR
ncbi:MAG TPA: ATP-binding cassette domain-containing protein [Acidimicrobiales bacterium]|nr:ATP-binding cassette domain-containing protein [Acidimicrobiales bacterium]